MITFIRYNHGCFWFLCRLFVLPHYCSPMVDIALLHSRRKQNQSKQKQENKKEENIPNTNTKLNQSKEEHEPKKEEKSPNTKVYICATMWHENRVEMKQILISIFRFVILFGVFRPTGEFLLIWRRHQYRWRASNFEWPMLDTQDHWAV